MQSPAPVPGSLVWLRQRRWRVERARIDRNVVRLDVAHDHRRLTVLAPFDRPDMLATRQRPVLVGRRHGLARLAQLSASAFGVGEMPAAVAARIDLWPHQFEPALAARTGQRRILIADDVGLGKTIQAGLILADLLDRRATLRALVVTPASLCAQWAHELRTRFAIDTRSADRGVLATMRHTAVGANPWIGPGVWIASVDHLKQRHVFDALPLAPWDVVIVDEAHTAAGPSERYDACDELGRRARHLVLLSATPHTGDEARFRRLVQMGALPTTDDTIEVFRRTRADVSLPHRRVVRWHQVACTRDEWRLFDALQQFERVILQRTGAARHDGALLLLSVFRKRALSTTIALDRSLARRLAWLDSPRDVVADGWEQRRLDFDESDDVSDDERAALAVDLGVPAAHERTWLRRLRTLAAAAERRESKVARLRSLVARAREPLVIFTEFRHSLEHLQRVLAATSPVAVLHGGQSDPMRRHELARFLDGRASVLVATDVGGQGLNLQSRARWVVNLELPWNPARLEQRIGRVDRIGQQRSVHATLLVAAHPAEASVLAGLARRTLAARRSIDASTLVDCAPPSHLAVASGVLTNRSIDTHPVIDRGVPLSTTRKRRARAAARLAARRRVLARRWRAADGTGRPPCCRLPLQRLSRPAAGVIVFAIPIVDRTGAIVERQLIGVTTSVPPRHLLALPEVRAAMEAAAKSRAGRRLKRVAAIAARESDRRVRVERMVAAHLHALQYPEEAQLGLFSRREATTFETTRAHAARATGESAARARSEFDRRFVELARPTIVWIGERR